MIYILLLLSFMTLNMAHPVTPALINALSLPTVMFGIFFAMMSIGNFVFSPIWGGLSDKRGRIKFMIIGLVGYGISQLGFGFIANPAIIIVFRFLGGVFAVSFLTVSLAYISDISTKDNRLKNMSYYAATSTIGGALGSLLGGIIGNSNYKLTFAAQFIFSVILGIAFIVLVKETVNDTKGKVDFNSIKSSLLVKDVKITKEIVFIMILVVVFYFSSTSYNSTVNYYLETTLNMSPTNIGTFLAIAGVLAFLSNIILTPMLGRKFKSENILKYSMLCMGIAMFIASISKTVLIFFIFVILFVCIASIYVPVQQNILAGKAKNNYGAIMGLQNSAKAVGMIGGSLFSGFIFDYGNKLPFLVSAIFLGVAFFSMKSVVRDK
ncbi:MAG: MFS transporter [Clostridium sp.]